MRREASPVPLPVDIQLFPNKVDKILAAARREFLAHGFGATSMDNVALSANVSKATVYKYFSSKRELFTAIIQNERGRYANLSLAGESGAEHMRVKLTRFARTIVDFLVAPETVASYRMVVAEAGRLPDLGQAFYANGPMKFLDRLEEFIAKSMASGALRQHDPRTAAEQLIDLVRGDLQLCALLGITSGLTRERQASVIRAGVDVFYRAYQPAESSLPDQRTTQAMPDT